MLQDILSNSTFDIRLQRKCVLLVGDLAECQLENIDKAELPFFSDRDLLKAIVDLTLLDDLDLQEKVAHPNPFTYKLFVHASFSCGLWSTYWILIFECRIKYPYAVDLTS